MSMTKLTAGLSLLCVPTLLMVGGCACGRTSQCQAAKATVEIQEAPKVALVSQDLPPNAKPGECYAKVFIPEQFATKTETVCVREASERLEVVPARYEWVEERVVVKEASTQLEEMPAEFELKQRSIQTDPGHSGWHVEKTTRCAGDNQVWANEMYCLVSHEPTYQTMATHVQVKPVTTREVVIPAEYQTVRRQKLVSPPTTKRIPIPAEYASIQKTYKTADSRVEWRRVACDNDRTADAPSVDKTILTAANSPRPLNGEMKPSD